VKPRDQYRYGYRLWLDHETAMPLKSQLCDSNGKVIEQLLFSELHFRERISADHLQPEVSAEGFRWLVQDTQEPGIRTASVGWKIRLPAGFKLKTFRLQAMAGSSAPVEHLVYSDGLASVSVFIEPRSAQTQAMRGLAKVGAAFAYSRDLDGHQFTVVGEVPAETVQAIGSGVTKEADRVTAPTLSSEAGAPSPR
jgi:sigma-E factor negative regulatory protein RseB